MNTLKKLFAVAALLFVTSVPALATEWTHYSYAAPAYDPLPYYEPIYTNNGSSAVLVTVYVEIAIVEQSAGDGDQSHSQNHNFRAGFLSFTLAPGESTDVLYDLALPDVLANGSIYYVYSSSYLYVGGFGAWVISEEAL